MATLSCLIAVFFKRFLYFRKRLRWYTVNRHSLNKLFVVRKLLGRTSPYCVSQSGYIAPVCFVMLKIRSRKPAPIFRAEHRNQLLELKTHIFVFSLSMYCSEVGFREACSQNNQLWLSPFHPRLQWKRIRPENIDRKSWSVMTVFGRKFTTGTKMSTLKLFSVEMWESDYLTASQKTVARNCNFNPVCNVK